MNESPNQPKNISVIGLMGDASIFLRWHHPYLLRLAFIPGIVALMSDLSFQATHNPLIALIGTIASFIAHGSFAVGWLSYCLHGTIPSGLVFTWDRRVWRYLLWLLAMMAGGIYGSYVISTILGTNILVLGIAAFIMSILVMRFTLVFPAIAEGNLGYTPLKSWRDLTGYYRPYCIALILIQIPFAIMLGILLILSQYPAIGDQFVLTLSAFGVVVEYMSSAMILAVIAIAYRLIVKPEGP